MGFKGGGEGLSATALLDTLPPGEVLDFILNIASVGILVHDGERIICSNDRAVALLEAPAELLAPGASFAAFLAYGEARGDYEGLGRISFDDVKRYVATRKSYEVERRTPSGRLILGRSRNDRNLGIVTYTDVTEVRRLDERARLLNLVAEFAAQGIIVHDGETIRLVNDRARQLMQAPADVLHDGASVVEYFEWSYARGSYGNVDEEAKARLFKAVTERHEVHAERHRPDGGILRIDANPVGDLIIITYTDVTEMKQLDDRARLLNLVAEFAEQGIVVHDGETIQLANARARQLMEAPDNVLSDGASMTEYVKWACARGDYGSFDENRIAELKASIVDRHEVHMERQTPSGRFLRVDAHPVEQSVVVTYTDITEARRREEELSRSRITIDALESTDRLTGLANRRTFEKVNARVACCAGTDVSALLLLDLDRFKAINDAYGHEKGDQLLRTLSARYTQATDRDDCVARIGGDEFAVLATRPTRAEVLSLATRLRDATIEPVREDGIVLQCGVSVGVAFCEPEFDHARLFGAADFALYCAKQTRGGTIEVYAPEMAQLSDRRIALEADLRQALERDEFVLFYQAQIALSSGNTVGYEALIRWQHPTRGMVSPGEFIPLAEETGLIVDIGRWALRRAALDFAAMGGDLRVSVNVSPVQFTEGDVVADVRDVLAETGLASERLVLELTEEVLAADTEALVCGLNTLSDMGIALSLDDFGTGYASLSYLTRFPFSKLKIDRSFVNDMMRDDRAEALIRSILALADAFGFAVTAEGVEDELQRNMLARAACDEAQGFYFGRPAPLTALGLQP